MQQNKEFLYDYQKDAVSRMSNGCILNGGVGSGKSRTALYYYFTKQGGSVDKEFIPMNKPNKKFNIAYSPSKFPVLVKSVV